MCENGKTDSLDKNFDIPISDKAASSLYGIAAISQIIRRDMLSQSFTDANEAAMPLLSTYALGGLIDAIEILAGVALESTSWG